MRVIYPNDRYNHFTNTGVGLGNFDGLHKGHMKLINVLVEESKKDNLESIVYTFPTHPGIILTEDGKVPLITDIPLKVEILAETGLSMLYFEEFNNMFAHMEPEEFVKDILVNKLGAKLVVTGFDYRFGYKGRGNTDLLAELAKTYGFRLIVIPPVKEKEIVVSSTYIRNLVEQGLVKEAGDFLGRNFAVAGEVVKGRQIGRTIGFPTANVSADEMLVIPKNGIYISKACVDGICHHAVTNVGMNPTFDDVKKKVIETYILDFDMDIYGKNIKIEFIERIRDEAKFATIDELIKQIDLDVTLTKNYFNI